MPARPQFSPSGARSGSARAALAFEVDAVELTEYLLDFGDLLPLQDE